MAIMRSTDARAFSATSAGTVTQEIPLLAQIALCQLECGDVPRAEDALNRALAARAALGTSDPGTAARFAGLLDDVSARITAQLRP